MYIQWWRKFAYQHSLFIRLLIPYLMFIALAVLLGWVLYQQTLTIVSKEASRSNMQMLNQTQDTIDRRLAEISTMSLQISKEPKVLGFQQVTHPFDGANTFKVLDTQKSLFNYNVSNNFVLDYYLFFRKSNLALSSQTTYEMSRFYKQMLNYEGVSYKDWQNSLFQNYHSHQFIPAHEVMYQGKPRQMITYLQSLGSPGQIEGAVSIMIDQAQIAKLMSNLDLTDGGYASIIDDQGQVITSVSDQPAVDIANVFANSSGQQREGIIDPSSATGDMMITYTVSAYNGWTYMVAQPPHIVMSKVMYIKKITIAIVLSFLGIGILLAYLFAYRTNQPLQKIMSSMPELIERQSSEALRIGDLYRFIHTSVTRLVDNNQELQNEIQRQAPFLRETLFERLLRGDFLSEEEAYSLLRHHQIDIKQSQYTVGIIYFGQGHMPWNEELLQQLYVSRIVTKQRLQEVLGESCLFSDLAEDKIAVLFTSQAPLNDAEFRQHIYTLITDVLQGIQLSLEQTYVVAVGARHDSVLDIARAYDEARQTLADPLQQNNEAIYWFDDLPIETGGYMYSADLENRLINVTRAGEITEIRRLLDQLEKENFRDRRLPFAIQQLFLYELIGSLIKIEMQWQGEQQSNIQSLFQEVHTTDHPIYLYTVIAERYMQIGVEVDARKRSRNVELIDNMLVFIQEHQHEPDLCLDKVADDTGISKVYVSQFFKEQMGVNFSDYLEELRMNQAEHLLQQTSLTIRDISERVGYHSSNTFCRAFKRAHGLSATAYRSAGQVMTST